MLCSEVENIIEGMQICQVIGTRNTLGDEYIKGTSVKSSHWTHDNYTSADKSLQDNKSIGFAQCLLEYVNT